ncbi:MULTISPECIES: catalase [unclassified Chelatococcus]|uniref:catalase n=1 Tax=unclassified Chelatococcus TaxID=2638111 RepID=UPI001BCF1090|nr:MULTISPECIES: catalase [unclassified Chelatococcus]MBS7701176.1 catalase [Chelatococcus sp. YT9]MBX3557307.1 catalase [Chelatococcus sp.]
MTGKNFTTTNTGAPVASDEHSRSVGPDGPVVLHDVYLVEKLAQFNRERVPERVVHAKGGGAFGELVVTEDMSPYTKAALFQKGVKTPMLLRFSSVAGELGSPDTWRDVRGFALKFYTTEGNYDIVGNNTPVFFLRDGIKFPDFIRSQKRLPGSHLRDADMQWDFWTLSPESAHQVTYLMGDRGLPSSWRHLNGYSSHTYQWINGAGERVWVKYHFHNQQGEQNITGDVAERIAGTDADHYIRDLYEAIERGDYPRWKVSVQIMPYEDAKTYRFNPFDLTKVWPHADYPLMPVGEFVLNRNPENYFAQIEQAAFAPSNLVPGIDVSPDKMLLARVFSYADAHRYRIGPNYNELPVNRPVSEVHSYSKDGPMRHAFASHTKPVYAPNSFGGPSADPTRASESRGWEADGEFVRSAYTLRRDDDDFGQAGTLIRKVFTQEQRDRLVDTLVGQYNALTVDAIKERFIWYWTSIDQATGDLIAARVLKRAAE